MVVLNLVKTYLSYIMDGLKKILWSPWSCPASWILWISQKQRSPRTPEPKKHRQEESFRFPRLSFTVFKNSSADHRKVTKIWFIIVGLGTGKGKFWVTFCRKNRWNVRVRENGRICSHKLNYDLKNRRRKKMIAESSVLREMDLTPDRWFHFETGWPDEFVKKCPKWSPNVKFNACPYKVVKVAQKCGLHP
jgi:hypothetical protein